MAIRIRPAVAGLPSYRPGRAPAAGRGPTYKLSSNENPAPPLPAVREAVTEALAGLNRYPDMANTAVAEAVAARHGLDPARLAFGTGSVAVLYHLLQAVCEPGDEVVYAWRSFEAYPIAVRVTGARPVEVPLGPGATHDLDAMRAAVTARTRAVLLCTPNNPTGPALAHAGVRDFLDAVGEDVAVVLDEAYAEFVTDPSAVSSLELSDRPNVVVLRSFSKAYGLAGLRVGFAVADPAVAAAVRSVALPFGVSVAAQAAVLASLAAEDALRRQVETLVAAREQLVAGLADLGFAVPAAQGNFVWLPAGSRTPDYVSAFAAAGLSVRGYVAGEPGDGVRVSVGEPEANQRVLAVAAGLPH